MGISQFNFWLCVTNYNNNLSVAILRRSTIIIEGNHRELFFYEALLIKIMNKWILLDYYGMRQTVIGMG